MHELRRLRWSVGGAFAALLALLVWSRGLSPWSLAASAVLLGVVAIPELRRRRSPAGAALRLALALLAMAWVAAAATTIRLEHGARNWDRIAVEREVRRAGRLEARVRGLEKRTEAAAGMAAELGDDRLFRRLSEIRQRTGVDALALLDSRGEAVAWAGEHRGRIPATVLAGEPGVHFPGGTLFSYLYVVVPTAAGRSAMAAVLLQTGPPLRGETRAFAERLEAVTGDRPRFGPGEEWGADWTFTHDGVPVLHARFPALGQAEWRRRVARTGQRIVFGLALAGLALLSIAWLRLVPDRSSAAALAPVAGLSLTLIVTPVGRTLGLERLFSPALFVLPIPGDVVMEGVMVVLLPLAALVATLRPGPTRMGDLWLRLAVGGALVGGAFAVATAVLEASAGPPMLTAGGPLWYVLQPTAVVLLTVIASLAMPRTEREGERRRILAFGFAGLALAVALALGVASSWRPERPVPTPLLLAWAAPFALLARAVAGYHGRGDRLLRWLAAGWLAATAVIPHLWVASQDARLRAAEAEVASFGVQGDPFLSYLLTRFTDELRAASGQGEHGLDLLYQAWVDSGLAGEPYPLEIGLWGLDLNRVAHLPLGVRLESDSDAQAELTAAMEHALEMALPHNIPAVSGGISRLLVVPLRTGEAVSVAVGRRAGLRPASALAAFVEPEPARDADLELVPTGIGDPLEEGRVDWHQTETGWRSETLLREGRDAYHAHLHLRLPPAGIRMARGVLLLAADLLLLTLLWGLGRMARGDPPIPPGGWLGWLAGFRARLIVSLFAFFLLPTAVFGWAAYRALSEEVTRAAGQVAERAVVQAASIVPAVGLDEAAARIGEDLLFYRRGSLTSASVPEVMDLGLYSAWLPPGLFQRLRGGEALGGTESGELAGRSYLISHRRLQSPLEGVAVPVWMAARDVAVRQREFAHLVLFGVLVGALLSLVLSVVVGRALAHPIGELRRASAAVGHGNLRVRLPDQRAGEFGELFSSFNRMTRRLRRARAQELRTARILAWGEMARQVAHEIKNPLTPIKLSIQHIRRAYRDTRPDFDRILDSNVDQILVEIERLTEIARAFSRYGAPAEVAGATEPVDVAAVARDVLTLYSAPDRSVSYTLAVDGMDTVARTRASELREVIVNLLENARAAVGEAGRVEVRVYGEDRMVVLEVSDDGEGIPVAQLPRIFEPHFSTRSSGTGLGLAIVRRLVESWGGIVSADSEPGRGTTVRLTMPRHGTAWVEPSEGE